MNQLYVTILSTLIAAVTAIITAIITTNVQLKSIKLKNKYDKISINQQEQEKRRIQYIDPLLVTASDLHEKFIGLENDLFEHKMYWRESYETLKNWDSLNSEGFAFWCNGVGAGAMTMMYVNCLYFARASKIRNELPFIKLSSIDDKALLKYLSSVRDAFGGGYNIWSEIQDTLGDYTKKPDGQLENYKEFCSHFINRWDKIWYTRLIDFYCDIEKKQVIELPRIKKEINGLITFLNNVSNPNKNTNSE